MKRLITIITAAAVIAISAFLPQSEALCAEKPAVSAKAAVLISADTGEVVYSVNCNEKLPMASTTKIMTTLLCLESGGLHEEFTVDSEAIKVEYEEVLPDPLVIPDAIIKGGFVKIHTTGEKSSAIKVTRNYTQSGGIIQATVDGNGSKIINCDGNATFSNGKVTAFANGTVVTDTTSAGGIKCNGNIEITGGTIAIECNGKGSKGINCNSDVTVTGGELTLTATAGNYTDIADNKKSRAITATGNVTVSGGKVVASAYDNAIHATAITVNDGIVNAYSKSSGALGVDAVQNGGWLLTKDAE